MVDGMAMADATVQCVKIDCTLALGLCTKSVLKAAPSSSLFTVGLRSGGFIVEPFTPIHTSEAERRKWFLNMVVWGLLPHIAVRSLSPASAAAGMGRRAARASTTTRTTPTKGTALR
jgi:hypothetical protein